MLRVASFNLNGVRAAERRGLHDWLAERDCDVVALQELRCPAANLPSEVFSGYHLTYDEGSLAGRNGVAVLTRQPVVGIRTWGANVVAQFPGGTCGGPAGTEQRPLARELREFKSEGRYLEVDLADRPLTVASVYIPKGGLPSELQKPGRMREAPDGGARYERKQRFLTGLARHLTASRRLARSRGRQFLLLGDLNIAHEPQDVVNWRRQVRNSGFLPQEREWMSDLLGPRRLVDVVRMLHPHTQGPYSWWSWLGNSFANDTGWRIDYQLAIPALARTATSATTDRPASRELRLSDHAPVVVDYRF